MDIEKIANSCGISVAKLQEYAELGILLPTQEEVSRENIRRLGVLAVLLQAGLTLNEAGEFFQQGAGESKFRLLRNRRMELLDKIHKQQQVLDQIDYLLWEEKRGAAVK